MSVEQILKNVYTFLDILQTVLIGDLHDWNKDLIFDALKWAKYCQQLYNEAHQKPYKHDLDQQIQELGKLPWLVGNININLDLMAQAEDVVKKSLLQNSTLSAEAFEYVLSLYKLETSKGKQHFIKVCNEINSDRSILDVLTSLESSILDHKTQESLRRSLSITTRAEILFTFIQHSVEKMRTDKMDRTKRFLTKLLSRFAVKPGSLPVIAAALKSIHLTDKDMENCVKTIILHSVLNLSAQHKLEFRSLMIDKATQEPESVI